MSQQVATPPQRRYTFVEQPDGFRIDGGPERVPVQVTLRPTCWLVEADPQALAGQRHQLGLFQQHALIETTARLLMARWQPKAYRKAGARCGWQMRQWAEQQTVRGITRRMYWQVRRLLPKADPTVLNVQRALFAATFGVGALALDETFYRKADRFLLSDVVCYRAAAIAVRNVLECWAGHSFNLDNLGCFSIDHALNLLANWRGLFSPTHRPYPVLNKVLMNLPGGMSHHVVCGLSRVELQRPIYDRVELTLLCQGAASPHRCHEAIFQHARREQIRRALARVNEAVHNRWTTRRSKDLGAFANYLNDYPEKHQGNLVGLADKVVRWHRDAHQDEVRQTIGRLGGDLPTALPPIPLPAEPSVRFLARVSDVIAEGEAMQHCIASYAHGAIQGDCYLFHVEYGGVTASVDVAANGQVRQSYGPHNRRNEAAAWGERVLRRWGRRFPPEARVPRVMGTMGFIGDDDIPF